MTKKVLFIDRDGTIIREPEDFQIDAFDLADQIIQLGFAFWLQN